MVWRSVGPDETIGTGFKRTKVSSERTKDVTEILGRFDVVAFGPHPDDVEMGIAGTLIKMVRSGKRILNVCMTRGEKGTYGTVEIRRAEFERANKVMGTTPLMLDFPDTAMVNDYEGKLRVAGLVRETRPDVVFAPYHANPFGHFDGSANVDHFTAGELVRDGLKLARFRSLLPLLEPHGVPSLFYYMVPKHMSPTVVVDVSDVMDEVHASILAYETQMSIHKKGLSILDTLDVIRRYQGLRINVPYGEAFYSDEAVPFGPLDFFGPRTSS